MYGRTVCWQSFKKLAYTRWLLALVLVVVFVLYAWNNVHRPHPVTCWADNSHCSSKGNLSRLDLEPTALAANSIFLFESHENVFVNPRILCALESAANAYPDSSVYLLSTQQWVHPSAAIEKLRNKSNIYFGHLDTDELFENSPLQNWYQKRTCEQTQWPDYCLSDALRWTLLWKYGGTYLDNDVVILRPLPPDKRLAGSENEKWIGAGALRFPAKDNLIQDVLEQIRDTELSSMVWGFMGPKVLSKSIDAKCGRKLDSGYYTDCSYLRVLPVEAFYPIHWLTWQRFFKNNKTLANGVLSNPNTFLIHVWNKFSKFVPLDLRQNSPYASAARQFCPLVTSAVGDTL